MPRMAYDLRGADLLRRAEMHDEHAARAETVARDFRVCVTPDGGSMARHASRCERRARAHRIAATRLGEENIRTGG